MSRIEWVRAEDLPEGLLRQFGLLHESGPVQDWIANVDTRVRFLKAGEALYFPVTVNDAEWESSYVCSPYTAYVSYARDELLHKVPGRLVQLPLLALIALIGRWLRAGDINRNVHVNNFLFSTNPYPAWDGAEIGAITDFLTLEYPGHAIIFRSLNDFQHRHLLDRFGANGYRLVASRQVYLFGQSRAAWYRHNNNKQDLRLIRRKKLHFLDHAAMGAHLESAWHLYNLLYLDKYSRHNPQYTPAFFRECHARGMVQFRGYADATGRLKAFAGMFVHGDTVTTPLLGYDTSAPQQDALYIHATQLAFGHVFETGKVLNFSSGAPTFKRNRGCLPAIEYSAIACGHLPKGRRRVIRILQWVSNRIGVPLLRRYKL